MNIEFRQPFEAPSRGMSFSQSPVDDTFIFDGSVNGPEWYVSNVAVTPEVEAGGVVDVEVTVLNERVFTGPLHPDVCTSGSFNGNESNIEASPSWTSAESTTICTEVGGITPTEDVVEFAFPAPDEPGTYTVDITAVATGSNNGGTVSYEVFVPDEDDGGDGGDGGDDPGGRPGPGDGDDGDNGGDGGSGGGIQLPRLPGLDPSQTGVLVLSIILLLLVIVSIR